MHTLSLSLNINFLVITYGAYSLGLCGILQILANFIWFVVKNPNPLKIPFEDSILKTKYGFNFWATFVTGKIKYLKYEIYLFLYFRNCLPYFSNCNFLYGL